MTRKIGIYGKGGILQDSRQGGGISRPKIKEARCNMIKRTLTILTATLLMATSGAAASELKVNIPKVKLSGGISATGFNESRAEGDGSSSNDIKLTDAVIELSGGDKKYGGFDVSVGSLLTPTVISSVNEKNKGNFGLNRDNDRFGLLWSYVSLTPIKGLEVDAGVLPTNVGYELAATYLNPNTTFGLVWNSQPCQLQSKYVPICIAKMYHRSN